jgi:hypothetical protein
MTDAAVRSEVIRLHRFFDEWYAGMDGMSIDEFADAMDPSFTIVTPEGHVLDRRAIVSAVEDGFGKGDVAIVVENFHVVTAGDVSVCRYDEVQTHTGERTRRVSTAVMMADTRTPGGYRWIGVHETWSPS